jgi:hypothetical protein
MEYKKNKKKNNEVNEPLQEYGKPVTFEEVWLMFKETDKMFKETDEQIKETNERIRENDRSLTERFKETDRRMKELQFLFTSHWGKLVESLVEGDLVKVLNEKGISVERTLQRIKGNHKGKSFEFDIIAVNGAEIVIVEVKTTLRPDDVRDFLDKLSEARTLLSEYKDKTIYGAVAFLTADAGSERMAENKGLFVIRATGNSSSIINAPGFTPRAF